MTYHNKEIPLLVETNPSNFYCCKFMSIKDCYIENHQVEEWYNSGPHITTGKWAERYTKKGKHGGKALVVVSFKD